MDTIPILKVGSYLLVSIQVDMDDRLVLSLQDSLTEQIVKHNSKGVLIDISMLNMVDSFIGRMLSTLSAMAQILGAQTVIVGMQPAVAITVVELGMNFKTMQTALNVEKGLALLGATHFGNPNDHYQD